MHAPGSAVTRGRGARHPHPLPSVAAAVVAHLVVTGDDDICVVVGVRCPRGGAGSKVPIPLSVGTKKRNVLLSRGTTYI